MFRTALVCSLLLLATAPPLAAQEKRELRLRVISFNTWGLWGISSRRADRAAAIGPALCALEPDLVALQEVWVEEDGAVIMASLAEGGLKHQHHESTGLLGSGLLIASRYPLSSIRFTPFDYGGKPHKIYHGDYFARKGVLVATVATPVGALVFADTHLQARYGSIEYEPIQITQALQAIRAVGNHGAAPPERADDPARPPLILAGDLNSTRDAIPFRLLCAGADIEPPKGDLRIDWVLTRPGGRVQVAARRMVADGLSEPVSLPGGGEARLSDHPAIITDLRLQRRAITGWDPEAKQARWQAAAAEAAARIEPELGESQAFGSAMLRRTVLFMLLAAGFFAAGAQWKKRKKTLGKPGCCLGLAAMLFLHLATWAAYFAAFFEPWYQSGLSAALRQLRPL